MRRLLWMWVFLAVIAGGSLAVSQPSFADDAAKAGAGNQQETMGLSAEASAKAEAAATEGNQNPPAQHPGWWYSDTPVAISCNIPGLAGRTILVPAGKNPMDFCPATAIAIYPPISNDPTPPGDWADIEMQLNKDAQMQLDNLAAAKLRNKTPEQQTSGQAP
jgi:hypothetical protein